MIGQTVKRYETVTSTNDIARMLAAQGEPEGTVVVASEQTNGRGSRGRAWFSPAGSNLLLSVILRPNIPPERLGELSFVAAVAVAGTLRDSCGLDARVKWPNDVRVDAKKIAGILIETAKGAAVIGIGLNVNCVDFPSDIAQVTTSVAAELGQTTDPDILLKPLTADLDIAYRVYRARGFPRILEDWKELHTTIGTRVTINMDEETLEGIAVDVDAHGSLIVELTTGERRTVPAATIVSDV